MPDVRLISLVDDLRSRPAETEWLEYKANNTRPEMIGRLISAVSNGARMFDRSHGYVMWGVADDTHDVIGTSFKGGSERHKKQPLSLWLAQMIQPCPAFDFLEVAHPDGRVVLLEVPAATVTPTKFDGVAYIRLSEAAVALSAHPQREQRLWARLQGSSWESNTARTFVAADEVLELLDVTAYFRLLRIPLPSDRVSILERMRDDGLVAADAGGRWSILNLGACLFAQRLSQFPMLGRKAVRVIVYNGNSRVETRTEHVEDRGYAAAFESLIDRVDDLLPRRERIGAALREDFRAYPQLAIRELVANALIHQDMTIPGTGPTIEIFDNRVEIRNPGEPLIETQRFLDWPPRSRNEALAALMRRMSICEERGSGIDKVIAGVEERQLPPPEFESGPDHTRVLMFAPKSFAQMTTTERVRACYQHAALHWAKGERVTNSSLRGRFGIEASNAAQVSRVIADTKRARLIKLADEAAPKSGYVPFWA